MAVRALFLGNELTLASQVACTFGQQDATSDAVYVALSLSLEASGRGSWQPKCCQQRPEQSQLSLLLLAARFDGMGDELQLSSSTNIAASTCHQPYELGRAPRRIQLKSLSVMLLGVTACARL